MKDSTKKAVDKAIDDYRDDMTDAATSVAIEAHISGDIAAHAVMGIPIGKMEVQKEALLFGRKYKKLLKETGGTIIQGKRIDWLASHTEETRKAVYETIRTGLIEGKPVADIGGKLSVPGTVAHDLEKLVIRDAKYKYVRIARTETAAIQNQGTLNRFKKSKITQVEVIDGTDFDEACAEANGQIWTIEYARSHELEHPNCTRSFSPVIPDDWVVPDEAEPVKKPKITEMTAPPKPGTLKPATPKAEISEIADDLADRQIRTSKFGKLVPDVELDDPAHWNALLKRGWPKEPKTFKKSYLRINDKVHFDKDGNVFAISRYEIKGKTLRITEVEINPALKGPEYGKAMLRDIADDGLANGAIEINVSAWDDIAKELYNSAGLKQGTMKLSFSADATMMKELAGKTDLVITSRTKETSRITRYLKKLEKSDPEKFAEYKKAVNSYTSERYKVINPALRDGIDSDKVIARMTSKEHAALKREIDTVSEYLEDAPKFKGEVYRGVGFDDKDQFDDFINNFQGNTHTSSPQFTSSSIIRTDAEYFEGVSDYSVTLKIKSNEGSYIGGLSEFKEETEVLFNHGTNFKIKKIVKVSDKHYDIELEDVIKSKPSVIPKITKKKPIKPEAGVTEDLLDAKMYGKRGDLGNAMKKQGVDPDEYLSGKLSELELKVTSKSSIGEWRKATDDWLIANPKNKARNDVRVLRRKFLKPDDKEMTNLMYNKKASKKAYLQTGKAKYVDDANAQMRRLTNKEFTGLEDVLERIVVYKDAGRALYDPAQRTIRLYKGDKKRTAMHELGHAIEKSDPKIYEAMVKFRRGKSSGQKGKLMDITKNPNYEFHEIALKDDYLDPYVGKIYDKADKVTEVFSMGLEQFESVSSAIDFYTDQPEHFKAILKVLKE